MSKFERLHLNPHVFRKFFINVRPIGDSFPRDEIIMTSIEGKATLLVVNIDSYTPHGDGPDFIEVEQVTIMAANEAGQVFASQMAYTNANGMFYSAVLESKNIPRDILDFVGKNFDEQQVLNLVTAQPEVVTQYLLQAPTLRTRLFGGKLFDIDRLVQDLPKNSLMYTDITFGRNGMGATVNDVFSTFLQFRTVFEKNRETVEAR